MAPANYVTRVVPSPAALGAADWNALLALDADPSPFVRHEYLCALHETGAARAATGWQAQYLTLWLGTELHAACPMYLKSHSYGEYVFDWAWANAYAENGLAYYPKALVASPFTPVPGSRLLARDAQARLALVQALIQHCRQEDLSSLHVLFGRAADVQACEAAGMLLRHSVQFHWHNRVPVAPPTSGPQEEKAAPFTNFDHFLDHLQQDKRKKIRQERRKVTEAGVGFRWSQGADISASDWAFFHRCYERTYLEHGNAPYLSPAFFERMAATMPENWLLFVAERGGQAMAASLIGLDQAAGVAYGRYWGALERVDCLHFEACYYQPLSWCIDHGIERFEGGAQGEHKMARALLPVRTTSAHWLAHPAFADAVERYLDREGDGVSRYLEHLADRSPLKPSLTTPTAQRPDNV